MIHESHEPRLNRPPQANMPLKHARATLRGGPMRVEKRKFFAVKGQIVLAKNFSFGRIIYQLVSRMAPTTQVCKRFDQFRSGRESD